MDKYASLDYRDPEWVAENLGIDKNTVYKYLQEGTIPALHLGRKWLISESRLAEWLASEAEVQTKARREAATSAQELVRRLANYTPNAQEVVRQAHEEARRYGHGYLGQEHLVLALTDVAESAAAKVMVTLGISADRVRASFETRVPAGNAPPIARLARSMTARRSMRLAAHLAEELGSEWIRSEHILLGILQHGSGKGAEILADLRITLQAVRHELARSKLSDRKGVRP